MSSVTLMLHMSGILRITLGGSFVNFHAFHSTNSNLNYFFFCGIELLCDEILCCLRCI